MGSRREVVSEQNHCFPNWHRRAAGRWWDSRLYVRSLSESVRMTIGRGEGQALCEKD